MVKILLMVVMILPGCALFTKRVPYPVPVREPCLDSLPVEPVYPLSALNRSITAKALQPGNEHMGLDPVVATLYMQRAYIKAVKKAARPCLKLAPVSLPNQ